MKIQGSKGSAETGQAQNETMSAIGEILKESRKVVVKIGSVFYVFQSVCRDSMKDAGITSFHQVYDSVQFVAAA